jgi:hypothetical protein
MQANRRDDAVKSACIEAGTSLSFDEVLSRLRERGKSDRAATGGPSSILIDIESVVVNRAAKVAN